MPNDSIVYITLDVDEEHKTYTVSYDWTSKRGDAHAEACYICESLKEALFLVEALDTIYQKDREVKKIINC